MSLNGKAESNDFDINMLTKIRLLFIPSFIAVYVFMVALPVLSSHCSQMYSLFVGDLTPEVDDGMLYEFFYNRYPSCRGGKVVLDSMGNSK